MFNSFPTTKKHQQSNTIEVAYTHIQSIESSQAQCIKKRVNSYFKITLHYTGSPLLLIYYNLCKEGTRKTACNP